MLGVEQGKAGKRDCLAGRQHPRGPSPARRRAIADSKRVRGPRLKEVRQRVMDAGQLTRENGQISNGQVYFRLTNGKKGGEGVQRAEEPSY